MKPVCNATPLIHLSRIGRLELLRELYTQVLVPNAVADEVAHRSTVELDAGLASDWLKRVAPRDRERVERLDLVVFINDLEVTKILYD